MTLGRVNFDSKATAAKVAKTALGLRLQVQASGLSHGKSLED